MSRLTIVAAIVLTVIWSSLLTAQNAGDLERGARVRVNVVNGHQIVGYVERLTSDSLTVLSERSGVAAVSLRNVTGIDVSAGKSHANGALLGGLKGLAAGALVGTVGSAILVGKPPANCSIICGRAAAMTVYGVFFGIGGAASGVVIGAVEGAEQWDSVDRTKYAPSSDR
jgi:hypothetical protein